MEESGADEFHPVTILDMLGVDLCARAILDCVPVGDLARSERVSRGWQQVVRNYRQTCRTLNYEGFRYPHDSLCNALLTTDHRTIKIHNHNHSLPLVLKTLDKWGPYIKKVTTDLGEDTKFDINHSFALSAFTSSWCSMFFSSYLDIIVSKCPNLEQIMVVQNFNDRQRSLLLNPIKNLKKLKQIVIENVYRLSKSNNSDLVLSGIFEDMNCENFTIKCIEDLTGSFLTYLKSNSLKSLSLTRCRSLRVSDLLSAVDNIRNLTSLELDEGENELFDVHLLISEMTKLEELTLRFVSFYRPINEEWNQAFSRLGNLKRLSMWGTFGKVNDRFLEVLARGCKKMEYLKIEGFDHTVTARGVTALCCRSPSARTTLHFPLEHVQDFLYKNLFLSDFKHVPLYKELAALGCVELTLEWFVAACRDPRGRELSLNTRRVSRAEEPQKELKLIIFS